MDPFDPFFGCRDDFEPSAVLRRACSRSEDGEAEQALPPVARNGIASQSPIYRGVLRPLFAARWVAQVEHPSRGTIHLGTYDDSARFAPGLLGTLLCSSC